MVRIIFKCSIILFLSFSFLLSYSQQKSLSHLQWQQFLDKFVNNDGRVNYAAIIKNPELLNNYLISLSNNPPAPDWNKNEQLAYWINAYNAFTIKLIIDHYPVKSIKDIKSGFKSPWDIDFIVIKGKNFSLDQIENKILFKEFDDPRIHFTICKAAISSPQLSNMAFIPETLDSQLTQQTQKFINSNEHNYIPQDDNIDISEIFRIHRKHFVPEDQPIIDYINKYSVIKIEKNARVGYKKFNWSLNQ